ncbi:hypothetical protein C7S15_6763 [Burkholderia cepacia]|nr:hypothetical protein [Burkholderia cepacia]
MVSERIDLDGDTTPTRYPLTARRDIQRRPEKASHGRILCFRLGYTWTERILLASTIRKMNNCHFAMAPMKNAVQRD